MFSGSVASVTPSADAVTLREHHTFAELPDSHYTPRAADPRAGFFGLQYRGLRGAAGHVDGAEFRPAAPARESRSISPHQ